uniref:(northern house mosquito) hypothetical protein n=1 Tax=Culex pipiens TaxID=7175 RepID=A0A8D8JMF6_CULPI
MRASSCSSPCPAEPSLWPQTEAPTFCRWPILQPQRHSPHWPARPNLPVPAGGSSLPGRRHRRRSRLLRCRSWLPPAAAFPAAIRPRTRSCCPSCVWLASPSWHPPRGRARDWPTGPR